MWMMLITIAVFTLVMIVGFSLIFPQERQGDSNFPPYMTDLILF